MTSCVDKIRIASINHRIFMKINQNKNYIDILIFHDSGIINQFTTPAMEFAGFESF
jgi:hypothetical protein